jgi:hypothetical protein
MQKLLIKILSKLKAKFLKTIGLKEAVQDKNKNIFHRLWQRLIYKDNLSNQKKKNLRAKKAVEQKRSKDSPWNKGIKQIEGLIQQYEEFIKRDFFFIIEESRALLREWKSKLVEAMGAKRALPKGNVDRIVLNLQEINELYVDTEQMLEHFVDNCNHYQDVVKDIKRQISPAQQLNQVQSRLDRMVKNLEKGREMIGLHNNQDYKFITKYLEEKGVNLGLSRSF